MTNPLDQIARELWISLDGDSLTSHQRKDLILDALNRARALPSEPQEPTEEMIEAGNAAYWKLAGRPQQAGEHCNFTDNYAAEIYKAMRALERPAAEQSELRVAPSDEDASAAPAAAQSNTHRPPDSDIPYHCAEHGWWSALKESGCPTCVSVARRRLRKIERELHAAQEELIDRNDRLNALELAYQCLQRVDIKTRHCLAALARYAVGELQLAHKFAEAETVRKMAGLEEK